LKENNPLLFDMEPNVERYASRPTQFLFGDFALIAGTLPDADVITLDRVVRCYPEAKALLQAAPARTRYLLAFTYPRDRWYVRAMIAAENFLRRLRGSGFRVFVHPPQRMCATLEDAGFSRATRRETLVWVLDLYRRS
jgi:magnesium-protoporphyrin O-methyltransferase